VLTNEVRNVRLTHHGDRETTLRANEKALGVGGGMLTWSDPGDLLRYDSMQLAKKNIEMAIAKAGFEANGVKPESIGVGK